MDRHCIQASWCVVTRPGVNRNSIGYWPVPIMFGMPGGMQLEVSRRATPLFSRTSFCQAW